LQTICELPIEKLKFGDESHIVAKGLHSKRVLGIVGKRSYTRDSTLHQTSASLSILTSLTNETPFFVDYRVESNTQSDFSNFIFLACQHGFLKNGDYLVVDNASIHTAAETVHVLSDILDAFGIKVIKLPAYSPELNPCELVFSRMKRHIRNHKTLTNRSNLCSEIIDALSNITVAELLNYYIKCVCPKVILPDFFDNDYNQ